MIKKSLITLSAVTALSISAYGATPSNADLQAQIELLKAQLKALETKISTKKVETNLTTKQLKRIEKIEKKVARNSKKINVVKAHDAGDNLKFDVDFRTQVDNIQYELGNGEKVKTRALLSNRLWLGMKYKADENSSFYGTLSYNKIFGDNRADVTSADGTANNANFDWITNEAATNDNSLKVKEVYWLYANDSFLGNEDVSWTASVGRRPSTDGLGINARVDQQRKSALSHTVNVEFDGASARFNLDKLTGVEGMWLKFCAGRGLTNAKLRFSSDGLDYTKDEDTTENIDMAGFIFVPWDNGQYSVHMNYAKAWNLIGNQDRAGGTPDGVADNNGKFYEFGDMQFATIMFKADGIGEEINDYLDNTTFFASYAMSKTDPNSNESMLGSSDSETGHSYWIGLNMPDGFTEKGRWGVEWNRGSKYWRSMTYGEDSMVGSKIAARGTAWEIYYNNYLTKALSASVRFTKIDYDYTGSNGFFGDFGTPMSTNSANAANAVKEATNITGYIRYRF
jgi:hypothetical protein